jgi:predicted amidohydrolase
MLAPLSVAAAQPRCAAKDVHRNAAAHAELIRDARARVVVFPELSLTGYELDADPIALDDPALDLIVGACEETHSVALVGAPIRGPESGTQIGMLRVDATGVTTAYRKCFLGGDEPAHFVSGDGPIVIEIDGWRAGLGVCKDTGVEQHIRQTAALEIDVYLAGLVHHPYELEMQEQRARQIAQACHAYVGFASFAGPTGGGFDQTAGVSSLWSPGGSPIARASADADDFAHATLTQGRHRPTAGSAAGRDTRSIERLGRR